MEDVCIYSLFIYLFTIIIVIIIVIIVVYIVYHCIYKEAEAVPLRVDPRDLQQWHGPRASTLTLFGDIAEACGYTSTEAGLAVGSSW